MNAMKLDPKALQAITPSALSAYARSSGWTSVRPIGDFSNLFAGESHPEILVPNTNAVDDYASVVANLIEIFAEHQRRPLYELYRELIDADNDVVRVRALGDTEDGSISIEAGVELVVGAKDILLAAACAEVSPNQPVYRAGANRDANEFMTRVRLGQTEHGSFVVTMLTGISPPIQSELFTDTPPIERRVTQKLVSSLQAAREFMSQVSVGAADPIKSAMSNGVSANLCEALSRLIDIGDRVSVGVSWAKTRPALSNERTVVGFSTADSEILREGARLLRENTPLHGVEIRGYVHKLQSDEPQAKGTVSLRGFVDGKLKSISANLDGTHYQIALDAHSNRSEVIARGDLERRGERWQLANARVEIAASDD